MVGAQKPERWCGREMERRDGPTMTVRYLDDDPLEFAEANTMNDWKRFIVNVESTMNARNWDVNKQRASLTFYLFINFWWGFSLGFTRGFHGICISGDEIFISDANHAWMWFVSDELRVLIFVRGELLWFESEWIFERCKKLRENFGIPLFFSRNRSLGIGIALSAINASQSLKRNEKQPNANMRHLLAWSHALRFDV